jgi:hypothetical protein
MHIRIAAALNLTLRSRDDFSVPDHTHKRTCQIGRKFEEETNRCFKISTELGRKLNFGKNELILLILSLI